MHNSRLRPWVRFSASDWRARWVLAGCRVSGLGVWDALLDVVGSLAEGLEVGAGERRLRLRSLAARLVSWLASMHCRRASCHTQRQTGMTASRAKEPAERKMRRWRSRERDFSVALKDSKRRVSIWAWMVRKGDVASLVPGSEPDKMVTPARRTKLTETRRVILLTISDCMGGVSSGYMYRRVTERSLSIHEEDLSSHTQPRR